MSVHETRSLSAKTVTAANMLELCQYFRPTRGVITLPSHRDDISVPVCELIRNSHFDMKRDGLRLVRMYLQNWYAFNGHVLKQMVISGFFNVQDSFMQTPFHWIFAKYDAKALRVESIKLIIDNGGDPNVVDLNGSNVLHVALAAKMDIAYISALLGGQQKPSPLVMTRNKKGLTPMMILATQGFLNEETFKLLKDFGGDINEQDEHGNSSLHMCAHRYECKGLFKAMVEMGADVNLKNNFDYVPLRLAIDSNIKLEELVSLIPNVDVLNDDSCWDGPFVDYVFKNKHEFEGGVLLNAAFDAGTNHSSQQTLSMAIGFRDVKREDVELLLTRLGCEINGEILDEVISLGRFDLISPFLFEADDDLVKIVKIHHPYILARMSNYQAFSYRFRGQEGANLISLLVNKFDIDINYKDFKEGKTKKEESTLLHNLVGQSFDKDVKSSLDYVLALDCLNINQKIKLSYATQTMSPLDLALLNRLYNVAELLIKNFADTNALAPLVVKYNTGFTKCFQLLSVLGCKFDLENLKKGATESMEQELARVENWITERSKKVLSLKELSAIQLRKNISKAEVTQLIADIEIPEEIQDILFLKYFESGYTNSDKKCAKRMRFH